MQRYMSGLDARYKYVSFRSSRDSLGLYVEIQIMLGIYSSEAKEDGL